MADVWEVTRGKLAETITGGLSWTGKMDCPAWGISAAHCRTGSKLARVEGTVCRSCYAMKGTFRSGNVVRKLKAAYEGIFHPQWTPAMVALIRWHADERFRWFHSGDVQSVNHLRNIIRVCLETPDVMHWLPTREYDTIRHCRDEIPQNLRIRLSGSKVDGERPRSWPYTSTVVTQPSEATCPTSMNGGSCGDHDCTACWDDTPNVAYLRH